jgi:hypothetical protein
MVMPISLSGIKEKIDVEEFQSSFIITFINGNARTER